MIIAFHKPWGVLSQFNENPDYPEHPTLEGFGLPLGVKPLGRLDRDSEGLLLLSDDSDLERDFLHPENNHSRRYLAQVEGIPDNDSISLLSSGGMKLKTHTTLPCLVSKIPPPSLPDRDPPVRSDLNTTWLSLVLTEGKNRQIRRMTAAVGHPTLRLIRTAIGAIELGETLSGQWKKVPEDLRPFPATTKPASRRQRREGRR